MTPLFLVGPFLSATDVRNKTTYFVFDSINYSQMEEAAMGLPVRPILVVANLFLEWLEDHTISTFHFEIDILRRYVDNLSQQWTLS